MYENIKNHIYNSAQDRISNRIKEVNIERENLKKSGNVRYKNIKMLTATNIYPNKPSAIKDLLRSHSEDTNKIMSPAIARAIFENVKVQKISTKSTDARVELELKKTNLEFSNISEVYWGNEEYLRSMEGSFPFFYNLFLDLTKSAIYKKQIEQKLIEYIPFATYKAYEKSEEENLEFSCFIKSYKDTNIDVFAEAVYYFCMTGGGAGMIDEFIKLIQSKFEYESKDSKGRYEKKEKEASFYIFDRVFDKFIEEKVLFMIKKTEDSLSMGRRVYSLLLDDLVNLYFQTIYIDIGRGAEEYNRHLSLSGQSDIDSMQELIAASENYVMKLNQIQIDSIGNIELEYFNSELFKFGVDKTYFSQTRFEELYQYEQEQLMND